MGFVRYVDRMHEAGQQHLFPEVAAGSRGWATLLRLLSSGRFVAARDCGFGYLMGDIEATYQRHAEALTGWDHSEAVAHDVDNALMVFASPVGFLT